MESYMNQYSAVRNYKLYYLLLSEHEAIERFPASRDLSRRRRERPLLAGNSRGHCTKITIYRCSKML